MSKKTSSSKKNQNNSTKYQFTIAVLVFVLLVFGSYLYLLTERFNSRVGTEGNEEMDKVRVKSIVPREPLMEGEIILTGVNFGELEGEVNLNGPKTSGSVGSHYTKVLSWSPSEIIVKLPDSLIPDKTYGVHANYPSQQGNYNLAMRWDATNTITVRPHTRTYVVKQGDSLFLIAANELGSEGRYLEIIELNKAIYPSINAHTPLAIGMKLRLPDE